MTTAQTERVEEILCSAVALNDPVARNAYLEEACAGDASLRTAVDQLLSSYSRADAFLADINPSLSPGIEAIQNFATQQNFGQTAGLGPWADDVENKQIGPYKILQKLGEGGCGVVYLAEQEIPVRRRVALKIIKLGMDTRSVIARFKAEQQVLALMEHPNIAHVLDAGATETGRPYFVMELVPGIKLTEYCDKNLLEVRARLELFVQVCYAVQHAHQKGIIHRDIKPSNILVTLHDGVPVPKVIDFGIAKATEGRLGDNTITAFDQFIGTPEYMSPEQAELGRSDVDTRSDIYSLGVLLYELLAGRPPFNRQQLLDSGPDAMRRTLRETEPDPPSTLLTTQRLEETTRTARRRHTDSRKLISALRGDLDWIVMKALEKDRARRYSTANGLAQDVIRYLNNEPVVARPPSRLYRFQKVVQRNKVLFAAGAAVFLSLIAGLGLSTWMYTRERAARMEEAQLRLEQMRLRQEAEKRQKLTSAAALIGRNEYARADQLLSGIPAAEASVEYANVYRTLGAWNAIHDRWKEARERLAVVSQMDLPDIGGSIIYDFLRYGPVLVQAGDLAGYDRFRRSAISRYARTPDPVVAERIVKISLLNPADTQIMTSLQPLGAMAEKSLAPGGPPADTGLLAWRTFTLALLKYRQGDYPEAVDMGQRALAYNFPNEILNSSVDLVLAMAHHQLGDSETARAELDRSRAVMKQHREDSPDHFYWFDYAFAKVLLQEAINVIPN